jgi:hypothetical protein
LRKVVYHDFRIKLFDGGVGKWTSVDGDFRLLLDEALTLLDSGKIVAVNVDPFVTRLLDDPWVCASGKEQVII